MAVKLSSPPGVESTPKFSPDGKTIAFNAGYDGNRDVYTIPVNGGIPQRITAHGYNDRVVDWSNDGKQILFASGRESGKARFNQFYLVPAGGGAETKLPLAYAEYGSYSPDGKQMAVVIMTEVGRNWKRYRGGWKADIQVFNLATKESKSIANEAEVGMDDSHALDAQEKTHVYPVPSCTCFLGTTKQKLSVLRVLRVRVSIFVGVFLVGAVLRHTALRHPGLFVCCVAAPLLDFDAVGCVLVPTRGPVRCDAAEEDDDDDDEDVTSLRLLL